MKKEAGNYTIQDSDDDEEKSNFKQTNGTEELHLPAPIQSAFYEIEDIDKYGKCLDGANGIENVASNPHVRRLFLNRTFVASSSREKETELHDQAKNVSFLMWLVT